MGHVYVDGHRLAELNRKFEALPRSFFHAETEAVEHFREHNSGELPHTLFCDWLTARYELSPSRFEHWHPKWGRWLEEAEALRYTGPPHFPSSTYAVSSPPCGYGAVAVPEPPTWLLLAIGFVVIVVWLFWKGGAR